MGLLQGVRAGQFTDSIQVDEELQGFETTASCVLERARRDGRLEGSGIYLNIGLEFFFSFETNLILIFVDHAYLQLLVSVRRQKCRLQNTNIQRLLLLIHLLGLHIEQGRANR